MPQATIRWSSSGALPCSLKGVPASVLHTWRTFARSATPLLRSASSITELIFSRA